ncbi:hypothetical protein CF139_12695 [Aeromonas hydrophila]|nr:hypothetical protein CF139_12695 [Aeromonas hydrophila]
MSHCPQQKIYWNIGTMSRIFKFKSILILILLKLLMNLVLMPHISNLPLCSLWELALAAYLVA